MKSEREIVADAAATMGPGATEEEVIKWVVQTCLLLGAQRSTALRVAAEFARAFERGLISVKPKAP